MAGLCLLCLGLCLLLIRGEAQAQGMHSLREYMTGQTQSDGRRTPIPPVAHFTSDDGESFVFDTTQSNPLIRFDGDDEVWSLTPTPGPKGDVIFKNDVGEPVLRASRWGGFTLFSSRNPMGNPVAVSGKAKAINMGRISADTLFKVLAQASVRTSAAAGRLIGYSAGEDTARAETDYLIADTANNTADAIVTLSRQSNGKKIIEKVREVRMSEGSPPSIKLSNAGVLEMRLDVSRGWGGRPSSKRILSAIKSAKVGKK
jgi:Domain of unknown function (DUF4908)